jgi:hypothetical protein
MLALPLAGCGSSPGAMSFSGGQTNAAGSDFAAGNSGSRAGNVVTPIAPSAPAGNAVATASLNPAAPDRVPAQTFYPAKSQRVRSDRDAVTKEQVLTWAQQGTRDDIIIDCIERGQTIFHLSAADEQHLRQQGVSDDVIIAMRETSRR